MLEVRNLVAPVKLDEADLRVVLVSLEGAGWVPAILHSDREFLRLADVNKDIDVRRFAQTPTPTFYPPSRPGIGGDLFFRDQDILYLVATRGPQFVVSPYGRRVLTFGGEEPYLEVGIISSDAEGLEDRLEEFAQTIESKIQSCVDGRKTRHMRFDWSELKPGRPQRKALEEAREEEGGPRFSPASLQDDEVQAASVLAQQANRELLQELSRAGFARERDILGRKGKRQDELRAALAQLKRSALLSTECLLECKRTGNPLTRLPSPEQLQSEEIANLPCPSCGARFADESLSEGYSLSRTGRSLIENSHWMTIWVTNLLVKLGVPLDSILWNIAAAGEEVDLVLEFLGELWVFELKDREFGAGDAHPFNYRTVRYGADEAIIVTTAKVSKDAKRVFQELARQAELGPEAGPVYVEGLDAAPKVLRGRISAAALRYARNRVRPLVAICGYDLGLVIAARYGEKLEPPDESLL